MMLGGNISGRTNTLSLEIFNSVSRGDFDGAMRLCAVLAVVGTLLYALLEGCRSRGDGGFLNAGGAARGKEMRRCFSCPKTA